MAVGDPERPAAGRARSGSTRGPRRSRLDPETRRAQLVDAAVAQLDQHGLGALGVDDVADAAGVSRSLVYAYFGDRDGLAAEVYVRILGRLDDHLGFELPPDEAGIRRVVANCMAFAQANRAAWHLVVSDPCRQHPVVRRARTERASRMSERWHAAPRLGTGPRTDGAGSRQGGLAGAQLAAEAALGLLESGVLHWLDHPDISADEAATLLSGILWSGLTGPPGHTG